MAQLAKKNNHLGKEYLKLKLWSVLGYLACIACFIALVLNMTKFDHTFLVLLMLGFLAGGLIGGLCKRKTDILYSGIVGENALSDIVRALPDDYCGFQNLKVTYDGKTSELDMVVVGVTGVFIIETKNMGGTIIGDCNSTHWVQRKVGRGGTPYSKSFYSPIKQVGTHVYRLAHYLRSNGINVHVNDIVYFSNPETALRLVGENKTPVFSCAMDGANEIRKYILNGEHRLSKQDTLKTVVLLDGKNPADYNI